MTANSFGIATNTASSVINEVSNAIVLHAGTKYLHLPKANQEMKEKISEFETKIGMIEAYMCIDGIYIPIACPSEHSHDYFCYKQFHLPSVQDVCDHKVVFMDVECKWPSSVLDTKVFANSSICKRLRSSDSPTIFQTISNSEVKIPNYLIGDPAYPLLPYCMREYSTCKSNEEVVFNAILRSAHNPIQCAFGRLKVRWQVLTKKMDFKLAKLPTLIYACFVLHNCCERHSVYINEEQELLKVTSATKRLILKMRHLSHSLRIFLFDEKIMFRSRDIQVFVFLTTRCFTKFVTS